MRALVGVFKSSHGPPSGENGLVEGYGRIPLSPAQLSQRAAQIAYGVVGGKGLVVEKMHQPAVVELDQRVRVELLQPPADLLERLDRRPFLERPPYDVERRGGPPPRPRHGGDVDQGTVEARLGKTAGRLRTGGPALAQDEAALVALEEHEPRQRDRPGGAADADPDVLAVGSPAL